MSYLLRKFSLSKWQENKTLPPHEYTADSITGCIKTSQNTLSVWKSSTNDFESEEFKNLVVALAITMDQPSTIDVTWLTESWFDENSIDVDKTPGVSFYQNMNSSHRDLVDLNHEKLGIVGQHIVENLNNDRDFKRVTKSKIVEMVYQKLNEKNTFSLDDLSEKWQEAMQKQSKKSAS